MAALLCAQEQATAKLTVGYFSPMERKGTMLIGNHSVSWQGLNEKDNKSSFEIPLSDIKEVKGTFSDFHFKLKNGKKYNFRGFDSQGHPSDLVAAAAVDAINAYLAPARKSLNTITVENLSSMPAKLKLIGPSSQTVDLRAGASAALTVTSGTYSILIRYGVSPIEYEYAKAGPLTVNRTENAHSSVKITLRKPAVDDQAARSEFERDLPK